MCSKRECMDENHMINRPSPPRRISSRRTCLSNQRGVIHEHYTNNLGECFCASRSKRRERIFGGLLCSTPKKQMTYAHFTPSKSSVSLKWSSREKDIQHRGRTQGPTLPNKTYNIEVGHKARPYGKKCNIILVRLLRERTT